MKNNRTEVRHITGKVLVKNIRAVVSCDAADTVYRDVDILVEDGFIAQIGPHLPAEGAEIVDGRGRFAYPGLVNTHHHFFQTFVRNLASVDYPNMLVVEWLEEVYRIFSLIDSDVIYHSSLAAMADLLKHGCTTAFDHQYCYTKKTGKSPVDRQFEAAALLGIRYHAGRGVNTLPKSEGSTIPDEMLETTEEYLKDCERLIASYHDGRAGSMRQVVPAPCQPINSYRETFTETLALARDKGVYMHTHLGEGDNPILLQRLGKRSLDWCEEVGFVGPDIWFAHNWEVLPEEYGRLAAHGSGISHCPGPAVLGGFPILDIRALQEAGVLVSLGCDGSATNDSSNLLDSLRMAYLLQSWHSKQRGGSVSAYEMLKVATVNGAKTLGRSDIGSLEVGKCADLFMIDTNRLELTGTLHDSKNLLARVGVTGAVDLTMVGGKVVFQDGHLSGIDEEKLAYEGEEVCTRVLRRPCKAFHHLG